MSTGYPQDEAGEELPDLLDVPPFFGVPSDVPDTEPMAPPLAEPPQLGAGGTFGGGGASGSWDDTKVQTKRGVVLPRHPLMVKALNIAAVRRDVITSGNDGAHLPNSLHHDDLAIDVRIASDLRSQVGEYRSSGYTVLVEGVADPFTGRTSGITPGVGTGKHLHISKDPEGRRV